MKNVKILARIMTEHASLLEKCKNKIKTEHGGSNPKLHYAAISGKNSLTRVALLEEILQICSNNKLTKSRNHPKTPTDSRKAET